MPLAIEVGLGTGHILLDGDPTPPPQRGTGSSFGPCLLWPKGRPSQLLLSSCFIFIEVRTWQFHTNRSIVVKNLHYNLKLLIQSASNHFSSASVIFPCIINPEDGRQKKNHWVSPHGRPHMPMQTGGGETQPECSTTLCYGRGLC